MPYTDPDQRALAVLARPAPIHMWRTTDLGGAPARLAAVDVAYREHGLAAANEAELRMWVDGPERGPEAIDPAVREQVRVMNERVLHNELATPDAALVPLDPPALGRLEAVRAETLVIAGVLDLPHPLERVRLATERIPGALRALVAGAAHLPNLEAPETPGRQSRHRGFSSHDGAR